MRGPVIMDPFSAPNADNITHAAPSAAPACPKMRTAVSDATSLDLDITSIGNTYRYARFTARYTTTIVATPQSSARGKFRDGSFTSPATNVRSAQPSYAHMTETSAIPNPAHDVGVNEKCPPASAPVAKL